MNNSNKPIKYFKLIAILAIIWNILGVISYFFHVYMPEEAIAKLPEAEQILYQNIPEWKTIAFFIATVGGLLGSIFLFLKKKTAIPILALSLIGILVSFYYDFFKTKLLDIYGNRSVIFPLLVVLIGVLLVWYAKKLNTNGFIK